MKNNLKKASDAMKIENMQPSKEQLEVLKEAIEKQEKPEKVINNLMKLNESDKENVKKRRK